MARIFFSSTNSVPSLSARSRCRPSVRIHWLNLVGLDRTIPHRGIAVLTDADAMLALARTDRRVKVFRPITGKVRQTKAVM